MELSQDVTTAKDKLIFLLGWHGPCDRSKLMEEERRTWGEGESKIIKSLGEAYREKNAWNLWKITGDGAQARYTLLSDGRARYKDLTGIDAHDPAKVPVRKRPRDQSSVDSPLAKCTRSEHCTKTTGHRGACKQGSTKSVSSTVVEARTTGAPLVDNVREFALCMLKSTNLEETKWYPHEYKKLMETLTTSEPWSVFSSEKAKALFEGYRNDPCEDTFNNWWNATVVNLSDDFPASDLFRSIFSTERLSQDPVETLPVQPYSSWMDIYDHMTVDESIEGVVHLNARAYVTLILSFIEVGDRIDSVLRSIGEEEDDERDSTGTRVEDDTDIVDAADEAGEGAADEAEEGSADEAEEGAAGDSTDASVLDSELMALGCTWTDATRTRLTGTNEAFDNRVEILEALRRAKILSMIVDVPGVKLVFEQPRFYGDKDGPPTALTSFDTQHDLYPTEYIKEVRGVLATQTQRVCAILTECTHKQEAFRKAYMTTRFEETYPSGIDITEPCVTEVLSRRRSKWMSDATERTEGQRKTVLSPLREALRSMERAKTILDHMDTKLASFKLAPPSE